MKNALIYSMLLWGCLWGFSVEAKELGHIPSEKILEVSLSSLRDSADNLQTRNQWLKEKNGALQGQILALRQQIGISQMTGRTLGRSSSLSAVDPFRRELTGLIQQEQQLKQKLIAKQESLEWMKTNLRKTQMDVDALSGLNQALADPWSDRKFLAQKNELIRHLKDTESNLVHAKKHFQKLYGKGKSTERLNKLQQENEVLKSRHKESLRSFQKSEQMVSTVKKKIQESFQDSQLASTRIKTDFKKLQTRKAELEDILSKAKAKLGNGKMNANFLAMEKRRLESNLAIVQEENLALNAEYNSLEKIISKGSQNK
jgi:chromosome segregation ATPase